MASRDIQVHRSGLDELTADILSQSSATLEKIEENIRLTHTLRMSASLVAHMDSRVDRLSHNLRQYQHFLTQLNSLLLRAEFFESQLNMFEAEQQVNAMRTRRGLPSLHNWKDEDLNWRTTTATLDNLWMEYRYLSRKIQDLSNDDKHYSQRPLSTAAFIYEDKISTPLPTTPQQQQQQQSNSNSPYPARALQERFDTNVKLKPIRCSTKSSETTSRRTSLNLNLLTNSIDTTPKRRQSMLPTPDTTIDLTLFSHSSPKLEDHKALPQITQDDLTSPLSQRTRSAAHRHTRCKSSPLDLKDLTLVDTTTIGTQGLSIPTEKFNLRHFISHDTGLRARMSSPLKSGEPDSGDEGVKDSQFVNSPNSLKLEDFILKRLGGPADVLPIKMTVLEEDSKQTPLNDTIQETVDEEEENASTLQEDDTVIHIPKRGISVDSTVPVVAPATISPPTITLDETTQTTYVDDLRTELPTFEHRLNRSNSCDSIFSVMTTRIPVQPGTDSRAQTLSWMQKFSKRQAPSVGKTSAVSTISANNLAISSRGPSTSKQALASLVSQARVPEQSRPPTSNAFSFWFSNKKAAPVTETSTREPPQPSTQTSTDSSETPTESSTEDSAFGSSFMSSFLKPKPKVPSPLASVQARPSKTDNQSKYQSFPPGHPAEKPSSNAWPRFVNSFTPQSVIKAKTAVTSEVGKRSMEVPSNPSSPGSWNIESREQIKGSFSTLTIGPHGSKIVQHGESSTLGQSLVVTSRVSHAALKDALTNDMIIST